MVSKGSSRILAAMSRVLFIAILDSDKVLMRNTNLFPNQRFVTTGALLILTLALWLAVRILSVRFFPRR